MPSFHYKQDEPHQEDLAAVAEGLGFKTKAGVLRYLVRAKLLELTAAEQARQAQAAADLARERERMAPYAAPPEDEEEEDDIEEEKEAEDDSEEIDAIYIDDETPDAEDDEDGDDLDPGDICEFTPVATGNNPGNTSPLDIEAEAELRQVEALAEMAEGLPNAADWRAIVARAMVLLSTLAPAEESARIFRGISPSADPSAVVELLLTHARRWLRNKSLLN